MVYRRGLIEVTVPGCGLWLLLLFWWLRVVKSRSRNWKISIWFFVLGVTQSRIRSEEGSGESNVDQEVHRAWLGPEHIAESGWILSNMSQEKVENGGREILSESQCSDSDHDLWSVCLPLPHFQSQVKSRIVVHSNFKRMQFDFSIAKHQRTVTLSAC